MLMMRALWASATHSKKTGNSSPRATGPVAGARVLMMLAGWPPWGRHGGPERPPGEVPRGPMEKRGSDEAGSAAPGFLLRI